MNQAMKSRCELFVQNRNEIRSRFSWENSYMYPLSASIFTGRNMSVNIERMEECKKLLKQETGPFSNFRGMSRLAIISLLAADASPERRLKNSLSAYGELKNEFYSSAYLPVTAIIMADMVQPEEYSEVARRTRRIYDLMKKEHPLLTSGEDSSMAVLLALSNKDERLAVEEMEECYKVLKEHFFSGNAVQSLSHVLTLGEGSPGEKCRKSIELFEKLKSAGCKYGTGYELPTLGVLALLDAGTELVASEVAEVNDYLKTQKGFGAFGIGAKQRVMYAGMLVADEYTTEEPKALNTAAISGTISMVAAQEAALLAAIAASTAAASASSGASD